MTVEGKFHEHRHEQVQPKPESFEKTGDPVLNKLLEQIDGAVRRNSRAVIIMPENLFVPDDHQTRDRYWEVIQEQFRGADLKFITRTSDDFKIPERFEDALKNAEMSIVIDTPESLRNMFDEWRNLSEVHGEGSLGSLTQLFKEIEGEETEQAEARKEKIGELSEHVKEWYRRFAEFIGGYSSEREFNWGIRLNNPMAIAFVVSLLTANHQFDKDILTQLGDKIWEHSDTLAEIQCKEGRVSVKINGEFIDAQDIW